MTDELPGIENASWLARRLERRPTPPQPDGPTGLGPNAPSATPEPPRPPSPMPPRPERAVAAPPPPAARLLHHAPPALIEQPRALAPLRRPAFAPNLGLRLAQLAVIAQAVLGLITGVNLIRGTAALAGLGTGVNLPATPSLAAHYGVGIVVPSALLLLGAFLVSVPSRIVRALLVVMEVLALGLTLAAHFGGGSVLGVDTVVGMGATGSALLPFGAVVGLQSAVIYLLAIHPPTYRAFDR